MTDPDQRSLRTFILSVSLAVAVCVSGGFLGMAVRQRSLIQAEMVARARTDFRNLVHFRQWNARYGGVLVEKRPGVTSNPWLEHPDVQGADGRIFTRKNPALMTRELSEMVRAEEGYGFHITSLRPLNPGNAPDAREAEALRRFETGLKELWWQESIRGATYLRYMAPLIVEPACLECHRQQGYRLGQVRGGISVSFDIHDIQANLRSNLLVVLALSLTTTALLLGLVAFFFRQLVRKLVDAKAQLKTLALMDDLTGVLNRRSVFDRLEEEMERHRRSGLALSCILMDLDRFKEINDRLGHLKGDLALREVAARIREALRTYDGLGRYGGEEFLAVLPDTTLEAAQGVAERIRAGVAGGVRAEGPAGDARPVTLSLGVAQWDGAEDANGLVHRVDTALYRAKAGGRDRVEPA